MNEYELTAEEFKLIDEYQRTIAELQHQLNGALKMVAISHGLQGNYDLVGNRLVKQQ